MPDCPLGIWDLILLEIKFCSKPVGGLRHFQVLQTVFRFSGLEEEQKTVKMPSGPSETDKMDKKTWNYAKAVAGPGGYIGPDLMMKHQYLMVTIAISL